MDVVIRIVLLFLHLHELYLVIYSFSGVKMTPSGVNFEIHRLIANWCSFN
jgi:hypothetical protein